MITFKKTFDYYATDGELDTYVNNMFDAVMGDLDPKIEVEFDGDSDHRYVTLNILDKVLH
tara:strand:+ start:666 stop:845 length:180 start_codon:yes stop_codon:yes gene_type:complete